jgi:hypothetical protein
MTSTDDNKIRRNLVGTLESTCRSPSDIHGLDISKMVKLFESFGYSCKPAGSLRGISGVLHNFDFVCTKLMTGEKLVVQSLLQVQGERENIDVEIVKLRLSTYDCSPNICILVAESLTDQIKQMAGLYRLTVIESSQEDPFDQIESLLKLQA